MLKLINLLLYLFVYFRLDSGPNNNNKQHKTKNHINWQRSTDK